MPRDYAREYAELNKLRRDLKKTALLKSKKEVLSAEEMALVDDHVERTIAKVKKATDEMNKPVQGLHIKPGKEHKKGSY